MNTVNHLINLIQCSLQSKAYEETIEDGKSLLQIAKDSGLAGMIFNSIEKNKISTEIYNKFQKIFYNFIQKDAQFTLEIVSLKNILNNNEVDHIFLKGSFMKYLYPQSYMRSMGDIDILVKEEQLEKARRVLENHGYINPLNVYSHACFKGSSNILIEVHTRLNSEDISRYNTFLEETWENSYFLEGFRYELNIEYNLVYLLIHMVKHFNSSGVGLRSILDIGIYTNKYKNVINQNKLRHFLNECKLELFFKNILWLNTIYFNYDFEVFLQGFKQDDVFLNEITSFIILSGVHGRGNKFNRYICPMTKHARINNNIQRGKLSYIIKVIFPSLTALKSTYRYLEKYPFLIWWAWISRWLELAFKKTKSSLRKFKKLFVRKRDINDIIEIYEKMGI